MHMRRYTSFVLLLCTILMLPVFGSCQGNQKQSAPNNNPQGTANAPEVSFKNDVFPIIKRNCLPCHGEDQMNPSELYLENYADLMQGGKHGVPVVPGNADSSLMIRKLTPPPPFGDLMPLKRKTPISTDTLNVLKNWINQGAKNN